MGRLSPQKQYKIALPDYAVGSLRAQNTLQDEEELRLENVRLEGADLYNATLAHLDIRESLVENCIFMQADLDKIQMMDVTLQSSDTSAAKCTDGSLIRVLFMKSRMNGLNMSKSTLRDVTFKDCQLSMANFRFTKFLRVRFESCTLAEADFMGAELNQVEFSDCTIDRTVFDQVRVKGMDLRSSTVISLSGWNSLRGATIDSVQLATIAPQIAAELGIRVA